MSFGTKRTLTALGILLAAAGTGVASAGADSAEKPAVSAASVAASAKAIEASKAPAYTLKSEGATRTLTSASALERAGAAALSAVSLPPGGKLTVNWAAGAESGGDNEFGVRAVVEYNAGCQWLRYALANPGEHGVESTIAAVGSWPTMRDNIENATRFGALAAAYRTGDSAPIEAFVKINC